MEIAPLVILIVTCAVIALVLVATFFYILGARHGRGIEGLMWKRQAVRRDVAEWVATEQGEIDWRWKVKLKDLNSSRPKPPKGGSGESKKV
jgi:hypothetical protein